MIVSIWGNIWLLSAGKKSTSSFTFPLSYFFNAKVLLFWLLSTCLAMHTQSKVILSIYRKLSCLSSGKTASSHMLFWRLAVSILAHNSRTRILPNVGLVVKYRNHSSLILDYFQRKFFKTPQKYFLVKFRQKWNYHHVKNQKKLTSYSWEKCWTDGWTDWQQRFYSSIHNRNR